MQLRLEIRFAVGLLTALQILTAAVGAWLLLRTGPAVERILAENDYSLEAVERMRSVIAVTGGEPASETARQRFAEALDGARSNVTEPAEPALIRSIEAHVEGALGGATADREALIEALDGLASINRRSMRDADARAKRLSRAGAWALVGLAGLNLAFGLLIIRRGRDRLLVPLDGLYRVARAVERDDRRQRCGGGTGELGAIGRAMNDLLDDLQGRAPPTGDMGIDRALLRTMLERLPGPAGIVLADETLYVANRAGMAARGDLKRDGERVDLGEGRTLVSLPPRPDDN